jgi:flagellar basal body-associated protein FliL
MKKLLVPIIVVVTLLLGGGGTFAVMHFMAPASGPAKPVIVPPKPILFAATSDIVVTIPPDTGQPPSTYVQLTIEFATHDDKAPPAFDTLEPIIKADIINQMLSETSTGLQTQATRDDLVKKCLGIANAEMDKNANYTPPDPFFAAYITNLVIQN